jgi:hypothetical protein
VIHEDLRVDGLGSPAVQAGMPQLVAGRTGSPARACALQDQV